MKRAMIGSVTTIATAIVSCVALILYLNNTETNYFSGFGKDSVVIGCLVVAIAALVAWFFMGEAGPSWKDALPIAAPVLTMVAFTTFLNSRINGIAAIMTFEANEQNQADMNGAIAALVFVAVAAVCGVVNAFFDVKKS